MAVKPIALCLACSSSLSPRAQISPSFVTPCCARPICERCLGKNPRLRGYNPCLACLAGVALVERSRISYRKLSPHATKSGPSGQTQVQEESMFILGESDEEEEPSTNSIPQNEAPPPYADATSSAVAVINKEEPLIKHGDIRETIEPKEANPLQYYIQPSDTLRGIALRYGIDGLKICQMNSLPSSTLSTTPHLLHTRRCLVLPPSSRQLIPPPDPKIVEDRRRERTEKRFQFVTKEVDWRVAKAYVALAEIEDDGGKSKENFDVIGSRTAGKGALEGAVEQYLDDAEWETSQVGGPSLQGFPPFKVIGEEHNRVAKGSGKMSGIRLG